MRNIGAIEVSTQYKETGWWIGRYDKETKIFGKPVEATVAQH